MSKPNECYLLFVSYIDYSIHIHQKSIGGKIIKSNKEFTRILYRMSKNLRIDNGGIRKQKKNIIRNL